MAIRVHKLPSASPDLHAARTVIDRPVGGVKEAYMITRVERGRSELWANGKTWRMEPGAIALQQPGDVRREISRDGVLSFQAIVVAPRLVRSPMHQVLAAGDPRGAPFHRLHDAVAANADRLTLDCLLVAALDAAALLPDVRDQQTRPVRRAVEMLRARLVESVTLDELADHAGLDKFHLCRAFRAQIGMPPHAYLTRLRVLRAKQLLAAGVRPSEVAPRVGLYDQSQLNRHFRRIVGATPGEFAREPGLAKFAQGTIRDAR